MIHDSFPELTINQQEALRLVHRGMEAKEVAVELGISVAAATDRIKSARMKLGGVRAREAARLFVEWERSHYPLGSDPKPFGVHSKPRTPHPGAAADDGGVREVSSGYTDWRPQSRLDRLDGWSISGLIVLCAIGFMTTIVLIKPMIDGISWIAKVTARPFE